MAAADLDFLRPGLPLVVLGQFSFILIDLDADRSPRGCEASTARSRRPRSISAPAARGVLRTVTLPYLQPALIGAGLVALLMSFENFNTTLMLVGSDPPLTIIMYGQMREGATPAVNAVSLLVMVASAGSRASSP